MVELKFGPHTVDLPYTVRIPDVTEEMFDELVDEDTKAELIDGVMIVHSPASPRHNKIGGFLRTLMSCYAEEKGLGEVFGPDDLIHLATCRKFAPDAFFLDADDVPDPLPAKQFEGTPGLIAEVLSPSNRDDDLEDKRPAYREAGVQEIWLIDPDEQEVIIDRRRGKKYTTTTVADGRISSAVVKGFWLETAWLWAEPLPRVLACLREILGICES
jgi:Uma2 family endonuclease